jgi:hypothetical protein
MKVFIRNRKTWLYCAEPSAWAAAAEQARGFTSVPQAAKFALDANLQGIEIVLKCYTLPDEVSVPVLPEWCDLPQLDSAAA